MTFWSSHLWLWSSGRSGTDSPTRVCRSQDLHPSRWNTWGHRLQGAEDTQRSHRATGQLEYPLLEYDPYLLATSRIWVPNTHTASFWWTGPKKPVRPVTTRRLPDGFYSLVTMIQRCSCMFFWSDICTGHMFDRLLFMHAIETVVFFWDRRELRPKPPHLQKLICDLACLRRMKQSPFYSCVHSTHCSCERYNKESCFQHLPWWITAWFRMQCLHYFLILSLFFPTTL